MDIRAAEPREHQCCLILVAKSGPTRIKRNPLLDGGSLHIVKHMMYVGAKVPVSHSLA